MPFTLAHAAAAWPLRRTRLILPAVVVGTFAPDFEYFARLAPGGRFGHTLPGIFVLDLPLSLVVLWLFHAAMREPMVALLPESMQRRICPYPHAFRFWAPAQLALVMGSILVGAGTHILWDSFTHTSFWPYYHWSLLSETARLPILGTVEYYQLFQYGRHGCRDRGADDLASALVPDDEAEPATCGEALFAGKEAGAPRRDEFRSVVWGINSRNRRSGYTG